MQGNKEKAKGYPLAFSFEKKKNMYHVTMF
jgi:hypothetical protein